MSVDSVTPKSRRALLAGALGAAAASVAAAVGRPAHVRADTGDALLIGISASGSFDGTGANQASSTTSIWTTAGTGFSAETPGQFGIVGRSTKTDGIGVYGSGADAGVNGLSTRGGGTAIGVRGIANCPASAFGVFGHAVETTATVQSVGTYGRSDSNNGTGVYGYAQNAAGQTVGVFGNAQSPTGIGVSGFSPAGGTGVVGSSGSASPIPAKPKTGVFGQATQDADSRGVWGKTTTGRGVYGEATSGHGVRGFATSGAALYGSASTGLALRAIGRVMLDKSAGIATIAAGTNSVVVTPGFDVAATTAVVATLQGSAGGSTSVNRVVVDAAANTFRIYLTANTVSSVTVAWHAFN